MSSCCQQASPCTRCPVAGRWHQCNWTPPGGTFSARHRRASSSPAASIPPAPCGLITSPRGSRPPLAPRKQFASPGVALRLDWQPTCCETAVAVPTPPSLPGATVTFHPIVVGWVTAHVLGDCVCCPHTSLAPWSHSLLPSNCPRVGTTASPRLAVAHMQLPRLMLGKERRHQVSSGSTEDSL
jgi:hypothetical protein